MDLVDSLLQKGQRLQTWQESWNINWHSRLSSNRQPLKQAGLMEDFKTNWIWKAIAVHHWIFSCQNTAASCQAPPLLCLKIPLKTIQAAAWAYDIFCFFAAVAKHYIEQW